MGMERKLGEKREVVIGAAVQLRAQAVRSPPSLPPHSNHPPKSEPASQMLAIRMTVTIAQIHSVARTQNAQAHKDTHIEMKRSRPWAHLTEWVHFPHSHRKVVWQACFCTEVCGYYSVFSRKPKFPAATPPLSTHMRSIEWPPFSQWYLTHYWPVPDGLHVTSTYVQRGFNSRPLGSRTRTMMKGLHYLFRSGGLFMSLVPVLLPGGVVYNGRGTVCGFLLLHYLSNG